MSLPDGQIGKGPSDDGTAVAKTSTCVIEADGEAGHGELTPIIFWCGAVISAAHIYLNTYANLPDLTVSAVHWGSFAFMAALIYPASRRLYAARPGLSNALGIATGLLCIVCVVYVIFALDPLYDRGVRFIAADWMFSILCLVLVLEFARRTAGWFVPVLCLTGIAYMFWWGSMVGGIFNFPGLSFETTMFRSYFEVSGMFGPIATISSTFVFMFILFGAFLIRSGGGDFVVNLARLMAGRVIGGPGFIAVIGSALTGTVSGSAVANVVSTGVITIPLMKRAGFSAKFAAGTEAAASTGGQIMPPIMGAGAFVMASYTQIPYVTIVAVSVLPALMYFLSVGFWVRIEAKKNNSHGLDEAPPTFGEIMRDGGITFIIPMAVLVAMLVIGYTPTFAAAAGILSVVIASWLTPRRMGPRAIIEALALGAQNMVPTAMLLVAVGLIVMVVTATGIGNTISLLMSDWAGGSLALAILYIGLASLVLGMGLPVTAAYIVLGTLSAPALYELISYAHAIDLVAAGELPQQARAILALVAPDQLAALNAPMDPSAAAALVAKVPDEFSSQFLELALSPHILTTALLSAHMIIFWLSQDSNVTPPVCLAAFAAAAIARTPPMSTGLAAWRIAKGLYIIPILFAYTPLLSGDWLVAMHIALFGSIGIYGLACAFEGYGEAPIGFVMRGVLAVAGTVALWPLEWMWNAAAAAVVIAVTVMTVMVDRGRQATTEDLVR